MDEPLSVTEVVVHVNVCVPAVLMFGVEQRTAQFVEPPPPVCENEMVPGVFA